MCFFKKKASVKRTEDRDLVDMNSKAVESLVVLAEGNEELSGQLRELQEKLRFLIASEKKEVCDFDKKIKNLLEDMRIALTKSDGETSKKVANIVTQIKLAVADRNTKI